eukprot:7062706-Alexandrium_andersonii.AAC.1
MQRSRHGRQWTVGKTTDQAAPSSRALTTSFGLPADWAPSRRDSRLNYLTLWLAQHAREARD